MLTVSILIDGTIISRSSDLGFGFLSGNDICQVDEWRGSEEIYRKTHSWQSMQSISQRLQYRRCLHRLPQVMLWSNRAGQNFSMPCWTLKVVSSIKALHSPVLRGSMSHTILGFEQNMTHHKISLLPTILCLLKPCRNIFLLRVAGSSIRNQQTTACCWYSASTVGTAMTFSTQFDI